MQNKGIIAHQLLMKGHLGRQFSTHNDNYLPGGSNYQLRIDPVKSLDKLLITDNDNSPIKHFQDELLLRLLPVHSLNGPE